MKIIIRAASLIKSGPQRDLIDDYLKRANIVGRNIGIPSITESALDTRSHKTKTNITKTLLNGIPASDILIVLDERGRALTSRQMAKQIANWRDSGGRNIVFAIGGAEGFDKAQLPQNAIKWRFGTQTWPHKLVRVMIAEQIYRSLSILAGTPYHKD